jgi:small GTP-binding protein
MSARAATSGSYKIVVVGASSVGKSSIVQRLVEGTFTEDGTSTCGAEFYSYSCPVNNEQVKLQIWDTAGQERFRSISKSYFRNAVGAVLVYDITNMSSFDQVGIWLNDLQALATPNAYILLVGNKADLEKGREVGVDLVKEWAERHHLESVETSALSGKNIKEAFARMALEVSTRVSNGQIVVVAAAVRTVQPAAFSEDQGKKKERRRQGCCE